MPGVTVTVSTLHDPDDPFAGISVGDEDPIGPYDPRNICGQKIMSYPVLWHEESCLREPHPINQVHVSAAESVSYIWLDLPDWPRVALTDDGVVCRFCGHPFRLDGMHYADCTPVPALRGDEQHLLDVWRRVARRLLASDFDLDGPREKLGPRMAAAGLCGPLLNSPDIPAVDIRNLLYTPYLPQAYCLLPRSDDGLRP